LLFKTRAQDGLRGAQLGATLAPMNSQSLASAAGSRTLARVIRWVASNKLSLLIACYITAKYVLYSKIGGGYMHYPDVKNDFFPSFFYWVNPIAVDALQIGLLLIGTRAAFIVALPLSAFMIIGPHTFGFQHYVMSFYMFVWLALRDEDGSVWFGRATLSFLYLAATIGKSTPGWISGVHYGHYLKHLHQGPYWILGGEFLFGISFLLPFYLGVLIPGCIVLGMIHSISFGIFDAVGPIFGMLLTFVVYRESRATPVDITLPDDWRGRAWVKLQDAIDFPLVTARIGDTLVAAADGKIYAGNAAWAALMARIPALSLFVPFFMIRHPRQLGAY
jgi:hypothetical protein